MNGYSLFDDQKEFLKQIICQLKKGDAEGKPYTALLVPGDIYDRSIPPEEATILLSDFLSEIKDNFPNLHLFMTAGNHDSASRLSFASGLLSKQNIHITGNVSKMTEPVILSDSGYAAVYSLPYLYPRSIKKQVPAETEIENGIETTTITHYLLHQQDLYDEACALIMEAHKKLCEEKPEYKDMPAILLGHLFTMGVVLHGSERSNVGDAERVSVDVFKDFTYCAFGHIHGYHVCDSEHRCFYAGAPLAYHVDDSSDTFMLDVSFSEMKKKEVPAVEKIPFKPLHPVISFEGKISDFSNASEADSKKWQKYKDYYVYISYTDEVAVPNAHEVLKRVFPNLISAQPKERLHGGTKASIAKRKEAVDSKDICTIYKQFLSDVNGEPVTESEELTKELEVLKALADEIKWGENL